MRNVIFLLICVFFLLPLTGCSSSVRNVQFKINTEPEGAHVVYRFTGDEQDSLAEWIYLGNTPYRGVRVLDESEMSDNTKIMLKVMHAGYYDQVREWGGTSFVQEADERGHIFWTPYLVAHPKK